MPVLKLFFIAMLVGGLMMFFATRQASIGKFTYKFSFGSIAYFCLQLIILFITIACIALLVRFIIGG